MFSFLRTPAFDLWLRNRRDPIARARVLARIRSALAGISATAKR
jgi:hypothetical protein